MVVMMVAALSKNADRCRTWRTMIWKSMPRRWTSKPVCRLAGRVLTFASAIMKYHGLKMEEVNDTMGHLWNKTYQGTGMLRRTKVRLGR